MLRCATVSARPCSRLSKSLLKNNFGEVIGRRGGEKVQYNYGGGCGGVRRSNNTMTTTSKSTSLMSSRRTAAVATTAALTATITGLTLYNSSSITQTQQHLSPDLSIDNLAIPTIEATIRGIRLVRTVLSMICDYEIYYRYLNSIELLESNVTQVTEKGRRYWTRITSDGKTSFDHTEREQRAKEEEEPHQSRTKDEERRYWEKELELRAKELERAQIEYTSKGRENAAGITDDNSQVKETENGNHVDSNSNKTLQQKKEAVYQAAEQLSEAEENLLKLGGNRLSNIHRRAAQRLLKLCHENGGVYIKIGQHLANLDYLIPQEYIEVLSSLFDNAPRTDYVDVCQVIQEELGKHPTELFESFDEEPIASASLAQVHVAYEKGTGRKLAVKVQHRGLRETSAGDLFALTAAVRVVESLFDEFSWGWIVDELAPQLPKELDFHNEGRNSEIAASHIKKAGLNCIVPKVHWNQTTSRVLCMDFEDGFRSTDLQAIDKAGLNKRDIAKLVSSVFNAQVFQSGFVHCDPHPANVLFREHEGKPQMVLVDHGLYKQIDDDFRIKYARLWRSFMLADIEGIKDACHSLGVDEMYTLLAAMLTSRPFDEIIERSETGSFGLQSPNGSASDKAMLRGYAQRFIKDILDMLDAVPRQMLLLFKMNDCLRHIDYTLGSPTNTLVVAGKYAADAVYQDQLRKGRSDSSLLARIGNWLDYFRVIFRIQAYEILIWWKEKHLHSALQVP